MTKAIFNNVFISQTLGVEHEILSQQRMVLHKGFPYMPVQRHKKQSQCQREIISCQSRLPKGVEKISGFSRFCLSHFISEQPDCTLHAAAKLGRFIKNLNFLSLFCGVTQIFFFAHLRGIYCGLSASKTNPHLL